MKTLAMTLVLAFSFSSIAALNPGTESNQQKADDSFVVVHDKETNELCVATKSDKVESNLPKCEGENLEFAQAVDSNAVNQTAMLGGLGILASASCVAGALVTAMTETPAEEQDPNDSAGVVHLVGTGFSALGGSLSGLILPSIFSAPLHLATVTAAAGYVSCARLTQTAIKVFRGEDQQNYEIN